MASKQSPAPAMERGPANTHVKIHTPLQLTPSTISPLKIIIDKAEYEALKAKNKELQGEYNAIACSYSMLERDMKEVEGERERLKVALLQAHAELVKQNGMFARVLGEAQAVKQGQM